MDSLTHIAIGACIGDLFLGKKIGKKAMLYGAIAASLPDIDFVASFWLSTTGDLLAHRGITHSFLFAVVMVLVMAFFFRHRHRIENIPIKIWLIFLGTEISTHLFLDAFNAYGIGWLEPFAHQRFSFHVIFVADPLFSLWPGLAAMLLLFYKQNNQRRKTIAIAGLAGCSIYLGYCSVNKIKIDRDTKYALAREGIIYKKFFTTPAPFNSWLWFLVAETETGFQVGYRSVFDKTDHITFRYFSRNDHMLLPFVDQKETQDLLKFSQGYYIVQSSDKGVVFNDLRFGQMMGWQDPEAAFVFHYYLEDAESNHLVVQRGRFAHWDWRAVKIYIRRIRGI